MFEDLKTYVFTVRSRGDDRHWNVFVDARTYDEALVLVAYRTTNMGSQRIIEIRFVEELDLTVEYECGMCNHVGMTHFRRPRP